MRILITGCSGNVGYFLSRYFSEKNIKVIGIDLAENPVWKGNKNFKFCKGNVTKTDELKKIFAKEKPTHVIHLAFLMKPLHDVKLNYLIDVTGTENVIKVSNETDSVEQFIEFSSTSAYGGWPDNKMWIKETEEMKPGDYRYGIHKKIIEEYMNKFKKRKDLKFVTVRMCTAVGPSEYKKGGLSELIIKSPFLVKYDGKYCDLQLLHEDDLKKLIDLIVHDSKIEGIYNLVPDDYCSIKDLVPGKKFLDLPLGLVKGITGILWNLRIVNMMPSAIQLSAYGIVASADKLKKRYSYKFKYTTISAFNDAVAGMKKKGIL